MIGYIIVCFVDVHEISHCQQKTNEIIDLINQADMFSQDFTFLFKDDNFEASLECFIENVADFISDPIGMYWDEDDDDDLDEVESLIANSEDEEMPREDFYEKEYTSLYLQFVSSLELFEAFLKEAEEMHIPECDELHCLGYTLSSLDQMEILRRLQRPPTENDIMKQILVSSPKRKPDLYKKLNNLTKN